MEKIDTSENSNNFDYGNEILNDSERSIRTRTITTEENTPPTESSDNFQEESKNIVCASKNPTEVSVKLKMDPPNIVNTIKFKQIGSKNENESGTPSTDLNNNFEETKSPNVEINRQLRIFKKYVIFDFKNNPFKKADEFYSLEEIKKLVFSIILRINNDMMMLKQMEKEENFRIPNINLISIECYLKIDDESLLKFLANYFPEFVGRLLIWNAGKKTYDQILNISKRVKHYLLFGSYTFTCAELNNLVNEYKHLRMLEIWCIMEETENIAFEKNDFKKKDFEKKDFEKKDFKKKDFKIEWLSFGGTKSDDIKDPQYFEISNIKHILKAISESGMKDSLKVLQLTGMGIGKKDIKEIEEIEEMKENLGMSDLMIFTEGCTDEYLNKLKEFMEYMDSLLW